MATRGDAELIRSIGSIVGDIGGMLQASPQQLQAARIAADETSQTRTQDFTMARDEQQRDFSLELEALHQQNLLDSKVVEHKLNQYDVLSQETRAMEAKFADKGWIIDSIKDKVPPQSASVLDVVNGNIKKTLGYLDINLQRATAEVEDLTVKFGHNVNIENKGALVWDAIKALGAGDKNKVEADDWKTPEAIKFFAENDFTQEDIDMLEPLMPAYNDLQIDRKSKQLDDTNKSLENRKLEQEVVAIEELNALHDSGNLSKDEASAYVFSNLDAIGSSITLTNKKDQAKFNELLGQIKASNKKGVDPSNMSDVIEKKLNILITEWGGADWSPENGRLDDFYNASSPEDFLSASMLDFKGTDKKVDPTGQRYDAIIKLQKLNYLLKNSGSSGVDDALIDDALVLDGETETTTPVETTTTTIAKKSAPTQAERVDEIDRLKREIRSVGISSRVSTSVLGNPDDKAGLDAYKERLEKELSLLEEKDKVLKKTSKKKYAPPVKGARKQTGNMLQPE